MDEEKQIFEIILTEAMIEAATDEFNESGVPEYPTPSYAVLVESLIVTALKVGGYSVRKP